MKEIRPRLTEAEVKYILHLLNREQEVLDMLPKRPVGPSTPEIVELYKEIQRSEGFVVKFLTRKFSKLLHTRKDHQHAKKGLWGHLAVVRIPSLLQKKEELLQLQQQEGERLERVPMELEP